MIDDDLCSAVAAEIAVQIQSQGDHLITLEELILQVDDRVQVPGSIDKSWLVVRVKNEMLNQKLLYASFEKPMRQLIGLTSKGKLKYR